MGREGGCLAIKQDNELKTQKSMFAKGRKSQVTHEEANAATNKWSRKSRASGDQHAQTPTTRVEATSPGICDKPCHQQPRNAGKATSVHHVGGVQTRDRTPRNRSPTHHLMAGHKFMETLSCQERRGTVLQTTERERTQHPPIATSRRHAVTFPRTASCLARDQTIDSGKRIPKETKVMTDHYDHKS